MLDLYTIYYISLDNPLLDIDKLLCRLHDIGYMESALNNISFCPYLIIHLDFEDKKTPVYQNINKGYLNRIMSQCLVVEDTDIDVFITHACAIKIKKPVNSLF